MTALAQFDLVRFANERNGGPVHRVVSVMHDGMVELHDLSGYFAPHLFALADDVAGIPPAPPIRMASEEALRRIHEAYNDQDGSYWVDNVLRTIRDTMANAPTLRVRGVGRVSDEPRALLVLLTDIPTNNQLREMREYLREWNMDWEETSDGH